MTQKQPIPIDNDRLDTLLCDLIDIYSPSGKEVDILIFADKYFRRRGLPVHRISVDDRRFNIVVSEDPEESEVLFVGHIDTVPAWDLDAFRSDEDEGKIFGLGAADMKGGCAAMMEAFCSYYERGRTLGSVALALVVGEEETGDGAEALSSEHRAPWAIVGEPTGMTTNPGHFGYIEIELITFGKRAHASLPNRDHNAVLTMLTALMKFGNFIDSEFPQAIYNIRDVHSADAGFAVPDRCSAAIDLHLPPDSPVGKIVVAIEEFFKTLELPRESKVACDFTTVHHGYELPEESYLPALIKAVHEQSDIPFKKASFTSHSDANVLWAAGIKPVVFGPGSLSRAHTIDECIDKNEVFDAAGIYYQLIEAINGGK
ncbi:MAG: M20/M25/M40 family metallo-hydrolase [Chitinivibrionales bacterium]|nr:M20/M25/M40 family metallo-hydrolase [Chitinivibrionales bacterium]